MTRHLHSLLKIFFRTSCAIPFLCLTLGAPAGAMFQPEDDFQPASTSSSSASIPPAAQTCPSEKEVRAQRELDQLPLETSVIYLSNNKLNRLPDLSRFTQLTKLSLNSNKLESLDVRALPHLTELYLSNNPIDSPTRITGLNQLEALRTLDFVQCPLKDLDGISACPSLEVLALTDTPLTSITGVEDLPHLKSLYVLDCPLDPESLQIVGRLRAKGVYVHDEVALNAYLRSKHPTQMIWIGPNKRIEIYNL